MSDFKELFKQARASKASTAPTKEQLKALKAQRAAAKAPLDVAPRAVSKPTPSAASRPTPTPAAPPPAPSAAQHSNPPHAPVGLPADFFQAAEPNRAQHQAQDISAGAAQAVARAPVGGKAPAAGPTTAIPQGFFDNRQDDAKARGVKLPDAKDKEDQFKAFQRKIEEELRDQAAVEEDEAVEAAGDREDREAHEQRLRQSRIDQYRKRQQPTGALPDASLPAEGDPQGTAGGSSGSGPAGPDLLAGLQIAKRRRMGTMAAVSVSIAGHNGEEAAEEDSSEGGEELLDWRAKAV